MTVSVFETNIRIVGGFLTAYAFTGDEMFVKKAHEVATLLLPAFDTPTGIPYGYVNPKTGVRGNYIIDFYITFTFKNLENISTYYLLFIIHSTQYIRLFCIYFFLIRILTGEAAAFCQNSELFI